MTMTNTMLLLIATVLVLVIAANAEYAFAADHYASYKNVTILETIGRC